MIKKETVQEEPNPGIYCMFLVINRLKHYVITMLSEDIHHHNIYLPFLLNSGSKFLLLVNCFAF
jgi:hypothetical protein